MRIKDKREASIKHLKARKDEWHIRTTRRYYDKVVNAYLEGRSHTWIQTCDIESYHDTVRALRYKGIDFELQLDLCRSNCRVVFK